MALVNHKKMKIEDEDALEKEADKTADLAKKSLHDLSQVGIFYNGKQLNYFQIYWKTIKTIILT